MSFTGRTPEFSNELVTNNDFFPDIKVGDFQEKYRVAQQFGLEMVKQSLTLALVEVNSRLAAQQAAWMQAGIYDLDDAPDQPAEGAFSTLYQAAVMHWAKSDLMRRYPTVTDRKTSEVTGQHAEASEDWYRSRADHYIRQLTGMRGITCELL